MPRLSPRLFLEARKHHALLPLILQTTRDIGSARNEFRWLKEHAIAATKRTAPPARQGWRQKLRALCIERGRGRPLQYLLGTEYFGNLEIICKPGVLIPRQETAASVAYLVNRLAQRRSQLPSTLRVLDLCTGTGCIPLLFHDELYSAIPKHPHLELLGFDLSMDAVSLARLNLQGQLRDQANARDGKSPRAQSLERTNFVRADVLARVDPDEDPTTPSVEGLLREVSDSGEGRSEWDILTCNPPYISPKAFNHTTARSVRNFEPKLALVPAERPGLSDDETGDMFYPRLLEIADFVRAKVVLFEVADLEQAQRVADMVVSRNAFERVEIWRDDPSQIHDHHDHIGDMESVRIRGEGNGRTVVAWRAEALDWLGE